MTEETRQALRDAIEERKKLSPGTMFRDMVARGVIDEKGRVLLPSRAPIDPSKPPYEPDDEETNSQS